MSKAPKPVLTVQNVAREVARIQSLRIQAATERSHYYTAGVLEGAERILLVVLRDLSEKVERRG